MKIFISVGHSKLANGNYTSADGRKWNGCLEYDYNKKLIKSLEKYLKSAGHTVTTCICPEGKFSKASEEKSYKIPIENKGNFDLAIELHLNASSTHMAYGCEVLYYSSNGKKWAKKIEAELDDLFHGRGVKYRDNLYFLKSTKAPAVMIESFFCDNEDDYKRGKDYDSVAKKIAEGIHGKTITIKTEKETSSKVNYTVQCGAYSSKENAEKMVKTLKEKGINAIVKEV